MSSNTLRMCHLYPDLLNLYGDRANLLALRRRCEWRGFRLDLHTVGIGEQFDPAAYDLVLLGGGQDAEQARVGEDLSHGNGEAIRTAVEAGVVFLCVCGGLQMMGRFYVAADGSTVPGLGAIDLETHAGSVRMIGDVSGTSGILRAAGRDPLLVGFENHGGRTFLGQSSPLGKVVHGHGNNGKDGHEGVRDGSLIGTYLHGPLLPKNAWLADHLIATALEHHHGERPELEPLEDELERAAHQTALTAARNG